MATIGQHLVTPETGWRRYEQYNTLFVYHGNWTANSDNSQSAGTSVYNTQLGSTVAFKFYGTKLRIYSAYNSSGCSDNVSIVVDGESATFSCVGATLQYSVLVYEKTGLNLGFHTVLITNNTSLVQHFDAIDIDDTGYLSATIASYLPTPETGWTRFDSTDSNITIVTAPSTDSAGGYGYYGGSEQYWSGTTNVTLLKFNFTGTKIRLLGYSDNKYYLSTTTSLLIDDKIYPMTYSGINRSNQVLLDVSGLSAGEHSASIYNGSYTGYISLDSIDLETGGVLKAYDRWVARTKSSIAAMVPGDRIPFTYSAPVNDVGTFSSLGNSTATDIPTTGTQTPAGRAYFYHVGYDTQGNIKLVADRNIQFGISWSTLNNYGLVEGAPVTISGTTGVMRLLSGGTSGTADPDNEWDHIVCNSSLLGIPGDNSVWNWSDTTSMCSTWEGASAYPVVRGRSSVSLWSGVDCSATTTQWTGFRPVFLVPYIPHRFLVQVGTDIKTYSAGSWTSLGSITPTEDTFKSSGMSSIPSLPLPSNATLLLYTNSSSPSATYSAKPLQSTLIPKALYTVTDTLSKIQVPATGVKFLITFDLATYYKYNGTTLVAASTSTPSDFMDYTTLNSIPSSLLQNSFALALLTPDSTDFSLDKVEVVVNGSQGFSVEIAGNEVSPLSTNSERTIPLTSIPLGTSTLTVKAGDVTATVPITREAIARQSVKRSIKSYEGGYQGTSPVGDTTTHTPLVSTPSFANPWGTSKQWFGNRISTGIKGVQKISAVPALSVSGVYRYTVNSNKVRKIEVN